jgi:hypothetical protein
VKKVALLVLLASSACDSIITAPPKPPDPIDACIGLPGMSAVIVPDTVRVNGAATITASGGSGRFTYVVSNDMPSGSLSGTRYVAGLVTGTDTITASDDCGNFATVSVEVTAAFEVQPERAVVAPGSSFLIRVMGARGAPTFIAQGGTLLSGGSIAGDGRYTAGTGAGTDVVLVRDSVTGDQAAVVITVSPSARFRTASERLALPTGTFIPLETLDGTGVVTWSFIGTALGSIEQRSTGTVFVAPNTGNGETVELEAKDELINQTARIKVRLLSELTRPDLVAQGRRSDVATLVTGDFDGDGIEDVALGVPESDLNRPQGGAVFIFKGAMSGLPDAPTWTIPGQSDTAQFGAVMAAGDLDGDGRADLAISAPGDDVTVADSGAVYLFGIGPNGPRQLRAPLTGLGRGNFGAALAIADVDADGDADLIVGSPGADIAPGGAFSARGVIDLFLLQKDAPIPDLGSVRISGYDLDADAGVRRFSNIRQGRAIVATDLNGDSLVDLAFLGAVNNSTGTDGGNLARSLIAAQVHFGRASMTRRFEDQPDLYVLPANLADGDEGTWRLGFIPASGGRPPLLVAAADRADSPDLRANDAGTQGGGNAGGALLFDLSSVQPTGTPTGFPQQLTRTGAWARVYGDQANIQAARSFALVDADGDGTQELVLGAPYAAKVDAGVTTPNTGRLEFFSLSQLSNGSVVNRPDFSLNGSSRTDILGTAVAGWRTSVVAFNGRASTSLGDFTGRLDVFTAGSADPASWPVRSVNTESRPAGHQLGLGLEVGPLNGQLHAIVGVPGWNGAAGDFSGNEVGAGQGVWWGGLSNPRVLAEGANTIYVTDAGVRAFGGRGLAVDVAMTDFDGDGRLDVAMAAPNFSIPGRATDGGVNSTEYAVNRVECSANGQTPGGVLVHLGQADGTFKEGFRAWAVRDIAGCVVPDGGAAATCQRSAISRNGLLGGFDFNGDNVGDLGAMRANGFEVWAGRAPDDAQLQKPSMACDPVFSLPFIGQTTSAPAALGDLDGDGCDEVGMRYSDNNNRQGVLIAFGYDPGGTRCGTSTRASWVRISGDTETGVPTMRLGVGLTRARDLAMMGSDSIAITADLYPYQGLTQPTVLLVPTAQIVAKRPTSGGALVSILGDGLVATPVVPSQRVLGFGRMVWGDVDVDGDGLRDLVVSAPGANINGDGTGAVFVFKGGRVVSGPNRPSMIIVADHRERGAFGQDLSVTGSTANTPAALGIGAPLSYRSGTANGMAFVLPLDF